MDFTVGDTIEPIVESRGANVGYNYKVNEKCLKPPSTLMPKYTAAHFICSTNDQAKSLRQWALLCTN